MLSLVLLTWRLCLAPNNVSKRQVGFNKAFEDLKGRIFEEIQINYLKYIYFNSHKFII